MAKELNEPVLPDDYPIYAGYCYVADGNVIVSDYHEVTAAQLKRLIGATELRRCDFHGRRRLSFLEGNLPNA